jgi:hypothetical protein
MSYQCHSEFTSNGNLGNNGAARMAGLSWLQELATKSYSYGDIYREINIPKKKDNGLLFEPDRDAFKTTDYADVLFTALVVREMVSGGVRVRPMLPLYDLLDQFIALLTDFRAFVVAMSAFPECKSFTKSLRANWIARDRSYKSTKWSHMIPRRDPQCWIESSKALFFMPGDDGDFGNHFSVNGEKRFFHRGVAAVSSKNRCRRWCLLKENGTEHYAKEQVLDPKEDPLRPDERKEFGTIFTSKDMMSLTQYFVTNEHGKNVNNIHINDVFMEDGRQPPGYNRLHFDREIRVGPNIWFNREIYQSLISESQGVHPMLRGAFRQNDFGYMFKDGKPVISSEVLEYLD